MQDKIECLKRIANKLAGTTVCSESDNTICKVLHKIEENLPNAIQNINQNNGEDDVD
ncbi:MAG: hypothetical protein HUJ63_10805 [Enterococcus sp.]|nr:hypothetical protein [Enterococcus sp.]